MNQPLHLVFSVLITEKRLTIHKGTTSFLDRDRVSVFLTTLRSLSLLPIKKAEFHIEFDETTIWSRDLVFGAIDDLPFSTQIMKKRLDNFESWQKVANSEFVSSATQIMLFSNDDHVFLSDSIEEFMKISKKQIQMSLDLNNYQVMVPLSHFPESHSIIPIAKTLDVLIFKNEEYLVPVVIPIGAILVSPKDFRNWFTLDFTNGSKFVGPENPFGPSIYLRNGLSIVPRYELFRHLDSYSHIGLSEWPYQVLDSVVKVEDKHRKIPSYKIFSKSYELRRPTTDLGITILSDSKIKGDLSGFSSSLLKACCIRFSKESISLLNRDYQLSRSAINYELLKTFFQSHLFRAAVVRTILELPLLGSIKVLSTKIDFKEVLTKHLKAYSIILYGAPSGYFRFSRILVRQIVTRRMRLIRHGIKLKITGKFGVNESTEKSNFKEY